MAAASSSSGGSFKYDVFINFRGEDTRRCFVCHLYKALKLKALDTFIDSEELRKGDDLSELLKAIQESRLSIVVFSKNYASSTWCLKELVQILECMDRQSQIVVPVFYEVDPSHVRKLKESFSAAFAKHESDSNLDKEELESWKSSLTRATNLSGYDSKNYQDDIQLIKSIVEDILKKLIRISPSKTDGGLIGIDSHMHKIDSLLELGVNDFRIVGIWGMGGIGKSTIAKAVYENISPQFEHKCFLDNVKEGFSKNDALQMVEDLLSRLLKINDRRTLDGGLNRMRERLAKKKILLVLDDVDALDQIETLIGDNPSFAGGSRIIITTRDRKLLDGFLVYEPELFAVDEALELFRRNAFKTIKFSESYVEISRRAIEYAHGLPLALKVLGGLLDNKTVHDWEYELKKIEKSKITILDDNKIGRVLLASYNGLDEWQKSIFLDIACFFRGREKDFVTQFHESCGFFPQNGLRVLEERSLVTVKSSYAIYPKQKYCLDMHDLIQEMGRDIVYRESTKDLGRRSRLWYHEDVLQVLDQNTPAEAVEGIILDLSRLEELLVNVDVEAFAGMKNLRILQIKFDFDENVFQILAGSSKLANIWKQVKQHVSGHLKFLSNELRVLIWHGCPLKSLPSDFSLKNLTMIDMSDSDIEQLWEGTKPLPNLVYMDLSFSKNLIRTPDLTEATNLKELRLAKCTSLLEVHPSISALKTLVHLDLHGCSNLEKFPNISGNMKELERLYLGETPITEIPCNLPALVVLSLDGCSKLAEFPEIPEAMEKLTELDVSNTGIKELPSSIDNLTELKHLHMRNCRSLISLPDEICNLAHLECLDLTRCSQLEKLPDKFPNLKSLGWPGLYNLSGSGIERLSLWLSCQQLKEFTEYFSFAPLFMRIDSPPFIDVDLSDRNLLELPDVILDLSSLKRLRLCRNQHLESLPAAMNRLAHLQKLHLEGCRSLKSIPELASSIQEIKANNCTSLETVLTPQLPCDSVIRFTFLNCLKLESTNLFIDIVESDVINYQDDVYENYMTLPGSEIPDWFNHQRGGSSVTVQLPPDSFENQLEGFAICAISNLRGAVDSESLESTFCCATFKDNDGHDNVYYPLLSHLVGETDSPLDSDHMIMGYISSDEWDNERKYTEATFKIVTTADPRLRNSGAFPDDSMTWEDCTWITSCGVRLFHMNPPWTTENERNEETMGPWG